MEECYDSILASLEATLMVKLTLANLFCRLEKNAGGFMTHGERVQVEELAGSQGTQRAISVMISILRRKDANAFFKFCDILDKSGNEIWCEELKSLAKASEAVTSGSPSIGGQLQPCEACMHPQAQLSAHRALTSECSHLENELSKEKARNEVLGAKCDELEARNHSMKEAYDQELMLIKEENQELKDQRQQLVQESTLVNKENQALKDQQQQLTKNLHAKQDEIYQLKKCIEQLKAIQKGENSVSEIVSPRVFSGVSECLQCMQHVPGGGEYSAVAVNKSYIAVTDDSSKCVHVLSKSGNLVRSFGQGRLSGDICGVTFDKNDNILVADSRNHKVLAFALHGEFVKNIERGDGPFNYPTDLAVSDNSYLYCCDRGNKSISIHDENLDFLWTFGSEGEADVCFDRPKSLCIGIDNMVYICDTENRRIYVYNFNGVFQRSFLTHCKPNCIAGCGEYILVTSLAQSILVYTISGQLIHTFGEKGETPGKFNSPFGIAADSNGTVYVADRQNKRIQVFRLLHQ